MHHLFSTLVSCSMAPKFLCCLPLRLGVLVISFIQLILTAASAAFAWWFLWYAENHESVPQVTKGLKIGLIIYGSIYTIAALLSFVGFLGAIFKKLGAIRTYLFIVFVTLGCQIAIAVFVLWAFYRARNDSGPDCIWNDAQLHNVSINICEVYRKIPQWAVLIAVIVPILVEAYACYVVGSYSSHLNQQKRGSQYLASVNSHGGAPTYMPVARAEEAHPLTQSTVQYPYSDQTHAFGTNTQHRDASNNA